MIKICFFLMLISPSIISAGTAGNFYNDEPLKLIEMPVAGVLDTKDFASRTFIYGDGTLLAELYYSPYDDLDVGLSLSANNLLGTNAPVLQNWPGLHISYRVLDEQEHFPAIKLGLDTQGRGRWLSESDRNELPSPGVFLVLSKQFESYLGGASLHGGLGYSIHPLPNLRDMNLWLGAETALWDHFGLALEYLYFFNDNAYSQLYTDGFISFAFSASLSSDITISLALRSTKANLGSKIVLERTMIIEYRL